MSHQRWHDCRCEDYPCCGHYDILYGDEGRPEYCDQCGGYHHPDLNCQWDDDDYDEDTDDEDVIAQRPPARETEDSHLDASYEDRYEIMFGGD
jgi:hypothetical protein